MTKTNQSTWTEGEEAPLRDRHRLSDGLADHLDIHLDAPAGSVHSVPLAALATAEGMAAFVCAYTPLMKALDPKAVGAYTASACSVAALGLQYAALFHDRMPDFSLNELELHLIPAAGYCRTAFVWSGKESTAAPEGPELRTAWLEGAYTRFYRDTLLPVIGRLSAATGLAPGELWGQLPSRFNYYADLLTGPASDPAVAARLRADYEVLKKLPGSLFGMAKNPFDVPVRLIEALDEPGKYVQMGNKCCQYFNTEGGSYCYTCPRISEKERSRRREAYCRPHPED
ncbi:hypothetical protein F4V43_06525 [Paenibacillus spiritus]|uniref:Uncharacterized protein n=1 Tax=Paenibacillus spiritus TaxID=2496557 RepID=A0A5J5GFW0_9BACL|nr:(2Fe-2S)-binding protein [Paenibacillus spiritus]KAA9006593.1 hypothetical protein F4V43_06525 [Paenibacillus spiritus]